MTQELIQKLEAGVSAVAADGVTVTMQLAGPAGKRVVNVATGRAGSDVHYQAPATGATVAQAARVASDLLAIHNL